MAHKLPNDKNSNRDHNEQVTERVRIFQRGKRWYANFQLNGKQMRPPLKTTSKKQARLKALKIDTELEAGEHGPRKKSVTIADAIAAYRDYLEAAIPGDTQMCSKPDENTSYHCLQLAELAYA